MSFSFGLSPLLIDCIERVLPGVNGVVDGVKGDVVELPPVTAVVIGDAVDIPTVSVSITLRGGGFLLPSMALVYVRRTAICFVAFALSSRVNLTARIASGTLAP